MPDVYVDELSVSIKTSTANAVSKIDELVRGMRELKSAQSVGSRSVESLCKSMDKLDSYVRMFDIEALKNIASELKKITNIDSGVFKNNSSIAKLRELISEMNELKRSQGSGTKSVNVLCNSLDTLDAYARMFDIESLRNITNELYKIANLDPGMFGGMGRLKNALETVTGRDTKAEKAAKELEELFHPKEEEFSVANFTASLQTELKKLYMEGEQAKEDAGLRNLQEIAKAESDAAKKADELSTSTKKLLTSIDKTFGNEQTKKITENVEKHTTAFGKLLGQFNKIAIYRLIRGVLKAISQYVKEGFTNLYEYSSAVGTEYAKLANGLKSAVETNKNAFATAFAPLVETVIPYIQIAVEWLTKFLDKMAQFNAVLFNRLDENGMYTAVVAANLSDALESAKELQRTLMGFDEINRLNGNNSDTNNSSAYKFEQRRVDIKIGNAASETKSVLDKIIEYAKKAIELTGLVIKTQILAIQYIIALIGVVIVDSARRVLGIVKIVVDVLEWMRKVFSKMRSGLYTFAATMLDYIEKFGSIIGVKLDYPELKKQLLEHANAIETEESALSKFSDTLQEKINGVNASMSGWASELSDIGSELSSTYNALTTFGKAVTNVGSETVSANRKIKNVYGETTESSATNNLSEPVSLYKKGVDFASFENALKLKGYANGGAPATGSLFLAGEAGPEYVGGFGGNTGVWNSDQLVSGMYAAMSKALAETGLVANVNLDIDGEPVYRGVVRRANNQFRATGRSAIMG